MPLAVLYFRAMMSHFHNGSWLFFFHWQLASDLASNSLGSVASQHTPVNEFCVKKGGSVPFHRRSTLVPRFVEQVSDDGVVFCRSQSNRSKDVTGSHIYLHVHD